MEQRKSGFTSSTDYGGQHLASAYEWQGGNKRLVTDKSLLLWHEVVHDPVDLGSDGKAVKKSKEVPGVKRDADNFNKEV